MSVASRGLHVLPTPYVESVRFSWERSLEPALRRYVNEHGDELIRDDEPWSLVRLTEAAAPRVFRLAREVADVLTCPMPFELLQVRSSHANARVTYRPGPFAIRLIGPVVSILDDGALRAMIGHEIGHYLAHGPAASPPSLSHAPTTLGRTHPLQRARMVASELTADRFGLLSCQDIAAVVRLEVAIETGVTAPSFGMRELDYLEEVCARVESCSVPLSTDTHPSHELRLYAAWLFWRSDVHFQLTRSGPADLTLREVDARLADLLTTPALEQVIANSLPKSMRKTRARARAALAPPIRTAPTTAREPRVEAVFVESAVSATERRFRELEREAERDEQERAIEIERRFLALEELDRRRR